MMGDIPDGAVMAAIGFGGGLALGLAARFGRFCTLGALEDALYGGSLDRLRMWALALGLAIIAVQGAIAFGFVDLSTSFHHTLLWSPAASIVGGGMFGYGMALAGNCGYGALARLGGGDLRSLVIVMVTGIAAFAAIGGPLARAREAIFPSIPATGAAPGANGDIAASVGVSPILIAIVIGGGFIAVALANRGYRARPGNWAWPAVVAAAIASGWIGTSLVVAESFETLRAESHSFTAPLGEAMFFLMTSSAGGASFAVGSVAGVLAGALIGSVRRGHFRWEACDDARELGRQIGGAVLMGVGGVTALGCSVGQGLTAFAALNWSAPVTLAAIVLGAAVGLRQLVQGFQFSR